MQKGTERHTGCAQPGCLGECAASGTTHAHTRARMLAAGQPRCSWRPHQHRHRAWQPAPIHYAPADYDGNFASPANTARHTRGAHSPGVCVSVPPLPNAHKRAHAYTHKRQPTAVLFAAARSPAPCLAPCADASTTHGPPRPAEAPRSRTVRATRDRQLQRFAGGAPSHGHAPQLQLRDFQRVRLVLDVNHDRRVHAARRRAETSGRASNMSFRPGNTRRGREQQLLCVLYTIHAPETFLTCSTPGACHRFVHVSHARAPARQATRVSRVRRAAASLCMVRSPCC